MSAHGLTRKSAAFGDTDWWRDHRRGTVPVVAA